VSFNVLAIDQGTSSTKALVVSENGDVLSEAEVAVRPTPVGNGGVEQDPDELLSSIIEAGRAALAGAASPVHAVGVANQGETAVAWRSHGEAVHRAISWQDRRASVVTDRLRDSAARLHSITGLPLDPYFTAPKLAWLAERVGTDVRVTGIDAWLNLRLTGRCVTDVSTASRSLLLDLDTRRWSDEAVEIFGLEGACLPEVVDCAGELGETSAFGPALPVTGLAVDQQAALVGERCLDAGEAKCTYGTGAFLLVTTGAAPRRSNNGLSASVAWQYGDEHAYCLDGQVYTAGSAVDWLRTMGLIEHAADLDAAASQARGDSSVVCVPSFVGLGAPYWQPQARAHLEGLGLDTGSAEIVRAVLEGIAAQVAVLVRAAQADLGEPLVSLRVDGGLTRSSVLMQTQADLLQIPVELYPSPHATALGVAALARLGAGAATTLDQGLAALGRRYEPSISSDDAARRLERFDRAARRVVDALSTEGP
jgi:glycerol kinase